ncbi:ABC transporter ATP-binding protein [Xanthobacter versatilis]|uniref:ABC transporter ATP-binding protein n=1 Tax=Xanthobacter autotrophicus (strain ATCC BAA-1158 / Py2) TaxID=78245 RepID=UPI00372B26D4
MNTAQAAAGMPAESNAPLLVVDGLRKSFIAATGPFGLRKARVSAVDGVSFQVAPGEVLGIVGESGCGKSTTARLLMGLIEPDAGVVAMDGDALDVTDPGSVRRLRRQMQMVFQDSANSLNPRLTILETIAYAPTMRGTPAAQARQEAAEMLDRVGLNPRTFAARYPHELSGGQRQRVNIARALALKPGLVVLDEPVAALDKSIEAQILRLLNSLKETLGLAYVFISHDLNVVEYICDRVAVMYLGRVVEVGPTDEVYAAPAHPYTRALLASKLSIDPRRRTDRAPISGDPPSPLSPPSGCRFRTRCAHAKDVCAHDIPVLKAVRDVRNPGNHEAACHFAGQIQQETRND